MLVFYSGCFKDSPFITGFEQIGYDVSWCHFFHVSCASGSFILVWILICEEVCKNYQIFLVFKTQVIFNSESNSPQHWGKFNHCHYFPIGEGKFSVSCTDGEAPPSGVTGMPWLPWWHPMSLFTANAPSTLCLGHGPLQPVGALPELLPPGWDLSPSVCSSLPEHGSRVMLPSTLHPYSQR